MKIFLKIFQAFALVTSTKKEDIIDYQEFNELYQKLSSQRLLPKEVLYIIKKRNKNKALLLSKRQYFELIIKAIKKVPFVALPLPNTYGAIWTNQRPNYVLSKKQVSQLVKLFAKKGFFVNEKFDAMKDKLLFIQDYFVEDIFKLFLENSYN